MFDLFSWNHIVILLVVALVIVGPKDLPRLMNLTGKWASKARIMANEFRKSFDEMARQAELHDVCAEIETLKKSDPASEKATNGPVEAMVMADEAPSRAGGEYEPPPSR